AQQPGVQIVQALQPVVEPPAGVHAREATGELRQIVDFVFKLAGGQMTDSIRSFTHEFATGENAFRDDFRGGTGSGRAEVRDEITDGEINFVSYGGHDRQ